MKRLCTICARGGSKGVPSKNTMRIAGIPLIAHSILQAKEAKLFDKIAVSSDSKDILDIASNYGADICVTRPDELATDTAPKLPVIQHCASESEKVSGMKFDTFIDLDCTSPLRNIDDIVSVVKIVETEPCSNVITGMPARRSPYFNLVELQDSGFVSLSKKLDRPIVRRQDAPICYDMNASIYAWKRENFFHATKVLLPETKLYVMPEERSIDIDSMTDFLFVSFLLEKNNVKK